jgi:glycosyltransferase involved in cell wall biosynthesis
MIRLSLVIPTFNEEENIKIPLDSAYDLVDEIVIVDGGSVDKTVEIAKSYGDKISVHVVDNPLNFLINKERGIKLAKGEWILQLDADERLSPELKDEIKKNIKEKKDLSKSVVSGYFIPRKNWFLDRFLMKGGVYPDAVLRLYKRDSAHFKLKDVHENVVVDGETAWTENAIEHYADPTFERYLFRFNRYTTFDSEKLIAENIKPCFPCYFVVKPLTTFISIYLRHKGFMDGFAGFVWALFSSIRFWVIYIKARKGILPPEGVSLKKEYP